MTPEQPITVTFTENEWWAVRTALDSYLTRRNTADPRLEEVVREHAYHANNKLRDLIAALV